MSSLTDRFKNSWYAFTGRDPTNKVREYDIYGSFARPDRHRLSYANTRTIVGSIYNQIAVDVAAINIRHIRLDEDENYLETIDDPLNRLFKTEANIDQTGREMIQDLVVSMFDEGCVALVAVTTDKDPMLTDSFKVYEARVGKIVEWHPTWVKVDLYNERTGQHQQINVDKRCTPIIENPFYQTMNEQSATAQRLKKVLAQLDRTNEQNSAGKIDMLIQLPYSVKGSTRTIQANARRKSLEKQLTNSQYGIGYIDVNEKVIQLNRSIENNLWTQAEKLLGDLYNELGFSEKIFDGTADEATMINYNNRTLAPVLTAITEEISRKWLSVKAQSEGQSIGFFRDPFKLVPVSELAKISDTFTRSKIMTPNEVRVRIGLKPSDDPGADRLENPNLNHPDEGQDGEQMQEDQYPEEEGDWEYTQ